MINIGDKLPEATLYESTGFGEACVAVNYAKHFLDPASNIFPGHSSNLKR